MIEYEIATQNGALINFSGRGKIEVSGKDRVAFLHRMLTNDVKNVAAGSGCYACLLNARAKVLSDMDVWVSQDKVYLGVASSFSQKVIALLNKFVVTDDVTLRDVSADFLGFGIWGPKAEELTSSLFPNDPKELYTHRHTTANGISIYCMCLPIYGKRSWYVASPSAQFQDLENLLNKKAAAFGIKKISFETCEMLRIESSTPLYGKDVTEDNLLLEIPQMAERAVSFSKGCYPGQEIVARMESRGKSARQFIGLVINSNHVPAAGTKIFQNTQEAGKITSACFSPKYSKSLALGFIKTDLLKNTNTFDIEFEGKNLQAQLLG